jgi:putative transposase
MELVYSPEFFTATILNWNSLLKDDCCKQIIVDTLSWLSANKRCRVNGFVIMPNHMHIIWKIGDGLQRKQVQGTLLSYSSHAFKKYLTSRHTHLINHYVNATDRAYQFWERNPMVKPCWSKPFLLQKLEYMHNNPCQPKWSLAQVPEDYFWSSAEFYENGISRFPWLIHYSD